MYAVVTTGGKQYRVEAGSELLVEKLAVDPGASVTFDRVLLIGDGDDVTVGTPLVSGATVIGTVLRAERGPKIVVFKFKQKVKYRRRTGHRQDMVRVRIDEISANGSRSKAAAKSETATPATADAAPPTETAPTQKPKRATRARAASGTSRTTRKSAATAGTGDATAKPKRAARSRKPAAAADDEKE